MTGARKRVLIVQRDFEYGNTLEAWFRQAGFGVIRCVGPHPPGYHCYLLNRLPATDPDELAAHAAEPGCPLVEDADVLIYDPWLYISERSANALPLIRALRVLYPSQPLVLAWAMEGMPALTPETSGASGVYVGPSEPEKLVQFVSELIRPQQAA